MPTLTPGSTQYYVDALKNLYFNNQQEQQATRASLFPAKRCTFTLHRPDFGLLVLAIACFNYTNLSLSRTLQQIKMIHIEKLMGAQLKEIRRQFILRCDAHRTIVISLFLAAYQ